MVEIVEHAILHVRRLIFSFIVDRRSPLVPLQGTEGSRVPQHDLIFLHDQEFTLVLPYSVTLVLPYTLVLPTHICVANTFMSIETSERGPPPQPSSKQHQGLAVAGALPHIFLHS